jgi:hypothetical protein
MKEIQDTRIVRPAYKIWPEMGFVMRAVVEESGWEQELVGLEILRWIERGTLVRILVNLGIGTVK